MVSFKILYEIKDGWHTLASVIVSRYILYKDIENVYKWCCMLRKNLYNLVLIYPMNFNYCMKEFINKFITHINISLADL